MDYIFMDLIGKPVLNPPKIISIIAGNFCLLEDQARFLKATLAIPTVKQLPFDDTSLRLIQIGPIQKDIEDLVRGCKWSLNHYEDLHKSICDKIEADLIGIRNRSIIFLNDISKIELANGDYKECKRLLRLADKLKRFSGHFVVLLYQGSHSASSSPLIRDLEFMSDSFIRVKSCKADYLKTTWWQTIPQQKTLIPAKVETSYFTCKIGKNYYSSDLLCFYERKKVTKNYDQSNATSLSDHESGDNEGAAEKKQEDTRTLLMSTKLDQISDDDDASDTLPYTQAQNLEQTRIFYYPDRDDDIDEDDPDNDLGI